MFPIVHLKLHVIKPIVLSLLKEVGVAVLIAESSVDVIRNSFPVRNRPGIGLVHWRSLLRVKLPVLISLEEIDLLVARPDKGRVNVVRNSIESFPDELGIAGVWFSVRKSPIFVTTKKIGFSVQICEGSVQSA